MRKLILITFIFLLNTSCIKAQWQQTALTTGYIRCLATSGTNILASDESNYRGLFLSHDSGANWSVDSNGLPDRPILSLTVQGSNIYAGTESYGVYLSINNGASWSAFDSSIWDISDLVTSISVNGTNILVGTQQDFYHNIYFTYDGGVHWKLSNATWASSSAIIGNYLFIGSRIGVFISNDSGNIWRAANNGLTDTTVWSLALSGTNIFAGTNDGIFLSTDSGSSWTHSSNGLPDSTVVWAIAIKGTNLFAGTLNHGVFLSKNNGANWTAMNQGLTNDSVMSLALTNTTIYAGTLRGGVFKRSLSDILAVENIKSEVNGLNIYPNPLATSFNLYINAELRNAELIINDVLGKEILKQPIIGKSMRIERGNLQSGVYIVNVRDSERQYIRKIIVE